MCSAFEKFRSWYVKHRSCWRIPEIGFEKYTKFIDGVTIIYFDGVVVFERRTVEDEGLERCCREYSGNVVYMPETHLYVMTAML